MAKVEFGELAKKLGIAKRVIRRLCYMPGSTLRYTENEAKTEKYFEEEEVLEMLRKSIPNGHPKRR